MRTDMTKLPHFVPRLHVITGLFFICLLVIMCRALQLAWISRDSFRKKGEKIALRYGKIPARRGELRDKNKLLLAWNERHFELWSTLASGESFSSYQQKVLARKFPERKFPASPDSRTALFFRLTPREVRDLEPLIKNGFPLRIKSKVIRISLKHPEAGTRIGEIRNGTGISGWEKDYNALLQGRDGRYCVLLDRRRNWIPSSWQMLEKPVHGQNVTVPWALNKNTNNGRRKR